MTIKTVRNLRRLSQSFFLLIFFWLIIKTTFEVAFDPSNLSEIKLPYPVSIALEFDPLTALMTLLSNGTIHKGLLWSLLILIPTIFLGRFFCGWVCPLGTINHAVSQLPPDRAARKGARLIESNRYQKHQRIKYYILFFFLGSSAVGVLQVGLLDPLPLLARSLGTFLLPVIHTAALATLAIFKDTGIPPLMNSAQAVYDLVAPGLLPFRQAYFHGLISIGLFFILILVLNRIFTRFYCRIICPLGALLGYFSRYAWLGLEKDSSSCDHCNKCLTACQGADNPDIGQRWRQAECHLCLNCQASCPKDSLSFKFFPQGEDTRDNPHLTTKVDISRRKMVASLVGGVASFSVFRSGDAFEANANAMVVRPPGSVAENNFLARCIRCGQCMRVCPNNALHPTMLESGLEGIWTPIMIARIGYCEPTCTLCGQVCPTGAISKLNLKEKVGDKETPPNRIGTAFIDRGRCLPWAMATVCIVCEEWCPTSPKSVYLREEVVIDNRGQEVKVKLPYVDPNLCTGCGACEFACPVNDRAAIYITSVGESRSEENQILLRRKVSNPDVKKSAQ